MATYTATDQQVIDNPAKYLGTDRIIQDCGKCSGTGSVSWGIDVTGAIREHDGSTTFVPKVCFSCNGTGKHVILAKSIRARHTRELKLAAQLAEQEKRAEQARLARAEWNATHPTTIARLEMVRDSNAYELRNVRDLAFDILNRYALPTEAELAQVFDALTAYEDAEAARADAPAGRQTVTVTVRGFKEKHSEWGVQLKMVVEHATGWKAFGSVPSGMNAERGDEIKLTATFNPTDDDPKFALFKMPRIAS